MVAANSVMSSYVSYFAPRRLRPLVEDNELPPGKKISLTIIIYQHMLSGVYQGNTFSNEIESQFKIVHIARKVQVPRTRSCSRYNKHGSKFCLINT